VEIPWRYSKIVYLTVVSANYHHTEKKFAVTQVKNHGDDGLGGSCSNNPCYLPGFHTLARFILTDFELTSHK